MSTQQVRSPLPWIGGKHYSAKRIIRAFPHQSQYDVYVDLFGGAAHVLIQKPEYKHLEIYNDVNSDLVNFWIQCRDNTQELETRCSTLPYARSLYYDYHKSLFDGTEFDQLERAVRWFYVLRSSFTGWERPSPSGWNAGLKDFNHSNAHAYHSAIDLFQQLHTRFRHVLIDCRDFAEVFIQYDRQRTLLYVDPPYIGSEHYYNHSFILADHQRLAELLNQSSSLIALSYYPHPLIDELYPADKWRRITWNTFKHSQRTEEKHEVSTELLLCNYPAPAGLWQEESEGVA